MYLCIFNLAYHVLSLFFLWIIYLLKYKYRKVERVKLLKKKKSRYFQPLS